jgi:hypothetical protein
LIGSKLCESLFPMTDFRRLTARCFTAALFLIGFGATLRAAQPSLVVVISIDQFRGDYLERFQPHFGEGGFNLFLQQGAHFVDCHHRHSHTKTAPGHAVMLTGVHAGGGPAAVKRAAFTDDR